MDNTKLVNALKNSLAWFDNSNIMMPVDGSWGVAERIFTGQDPELRQRVMINFNSYTPYDDALIVESRRPDCNFQLAYLELCAGKLLQDKHCTQLAQSLLDFLYFRSGMLSRGASSALAPVGVWNWSHTQWKSKVFFDDNAWCLMLGCLISSESPDLAARYEMEKYNCALATAMREGMERCLDAGEPILCEDSYDPQSTWWGRIYLPHWGGLASAALAVAAAYLPMETSEADKMQKLVRRYMKYIDSAINTFNASELSYALLGSSIVLGLQQGDEFLSGLTDKLFQKLAGKMDPVSGNIPAEHYEAPCGSQLVDFIYTVNWALLALQQFRFVCNSTEADAAYKKLLDLVLDLQDDSSDKRFAGCWRGMYDLEHRQWGGGSVIEGGADSIYSGWTNVPIALAILGELTQQPLITIPGDCLNKN